MENEMNKKALIYAVLILACIIQEKQVTLKKRKMENEMRKKPQ